MNGEPLDHEAMAFEAFIRDVEGTNIDHTFKKDWLDSTGGRFRKAKDAARYEAIMKWKRESRVITGELLSDLPTLKEALDKTDNIDEFNKYLFVRGSVEKALGETEEHAALTMKATGMSMEEAQEYIINYAKKHPTLITALNSVIERVSDAAKTVAKLTGEALPLYTLIAPLKPEKYEAKAGQVLWTLRALVKKPDYSDNLFVAENINFFEGIVSTTEQIAKVLSAYNISNRLKAGGELDNLRIRRAVNKVFNDFIGSVEIHEEYTDKGKPHFNLLAEIAVLEVPEFKMPFVQGGAAYKEAYLQLREILTLRLETLGLNAETTPAELRTIASRETNSELKAVYEDTLKVYDVLLDVQETILDRSPELQEAVIRAVQQEIGTTYALTDQFGRIIPTEYRKDFSIVPLAEISTEFIKTNLEYGINNQKAFERTFAIKALNGELYLMNKSFAEHLNKHFYTVKIPNKVLATLKKVSAWTTTLIMSSIPKLVNRMINYSLFDLGITTMSDPEVLLYLGKARRELSAMYQSKGKSLELTPQYDKNGNIIRDAQGRPVLQNDLAEFLAATGMDPVKEQGYDWASFEHKIEGPKITEKWFNTVNKAFTFQTLLVRYAYWLSIKKSFDEGKPKYGVAYANKELVDRLETNSKKAMYVVDQTLGAPGGFPLLANKLYGVAMFTTFPLALVRWGACGLRSVTRLINEAMLGETSWGNLARNLVIPALGTASLYGITHTLIKFICSLFGVDEETEEEWIKNNELIDPIATILNDSPVVAYGNSANPIQNLKEMFIEPFTKNKNIKDSLAGLASTLGISHLNPIIKVPIELATSKDFYGPTPVDVSGRFNVTENAARKLAGYFIGAAAANAFIEHYRYADKEDMTFFEKLSKATGKAIAAEFGNSRAYKSQQRNYYKAMSIVNTYYYAEKEANSASQNEYSFYLNSQYDKEDVDSLTQAIRRAMNNKASPTVIYALIHEALEDGYSVSEVKSALKRASIIGKLKSMDDLDTFYNSLSPKEQICIDNAILYEQNTYPILNDLLDKIQDAYNATTYSSNFNPYIRLPRVYKTDYDSIYPSGYYDSMDALNKYRYYKNRQKYYQNKENFKASKNLYVPQFTEFTGKDAKGLSEVFHTNIKNERAPYVKKVTAKPKEDKKAVMTTSKSNSYWRGK